MGRKTDPDKIPLKVTHDTFFVETFQMRRFAKAFLKVVLPKNTIRKLDLDGLTILPRHVSDSLFKGKIADVIYRVPIRKSKRYIDFFAVLEHKSFDDFLTIFQLWSYVYRICEQNLREAEKEKGFNPKAYRFPPVVPVIVHHGESVFAGKTQLLDLFDGSLPEINQHLPTMQAVLFDLSRLNDDEIPDDPDAPELKAVLMILKVVFRRDVGTKLIDIFEALAPYSDDPEFRRLIRLIWVYSLYSAKHLKKDYETILPVVREVTGDKDMPTMVEIWKAEGANQSKAGHKAEGRAESIIDVLKARFHRVPQSVLDRLSSMNDLIALASLTSLAATCKSLSEFEKALD